MAAKKPAKTKRKLLDRGPAFAREYVRNGGNGAKAIRAAGFTGAPESARVLACRLLSKVHVQGLIEREQDEWAKIEGWSNEDTKRGLVEHAKNGEPRVSVHALRTLAKIGGMVIDRVKIEIEQTPEQIEAASRALLERVKARSEVEPPTKSN